MPDVQIARSGSGDAPLSYTLPDNSEFVLKAVQASFDGSGAAGAFLPCVTILSDAGLVIARAVDTAVSVAAGGSAEVSFFPHVKHAGGSSAGLPNLPWGTSDGTLACANGPNANADSVQTFVKTNDSSYFSLVNDELRVLKQGLYLVNAFASGQSNTIAAAQIYQFTLNYNTASADYSENHCGGIDINHGNITLAAGTTRKWSVSYTLFSNIPTSAVNGGFYVSTTTVQNAGSSLSMGTRIAAVRLSDAVTGAIS